MQMQAQVDTHRQQVEAQQQQIRMQQERELAQFKESAVGRRAWGPSKAELQAQTQMAIAKLQAETELLKAEITAKTLVTKQQDDAADAAIADEADE